MLRDARGELRHQPRREVVPHARHDLESRTGDVRGRVDARRQRHERVVGAVQHQRGRRDRLQPRPAVARKFHDRLTPQAVDFLGRSPLAFLATVDEAGHPMVSPKGDQPGFIRPDGERTVLLPERSGNRLVFTLRNIVTNGRLAIIALAPGTGETLRLEGEAELDDAPALCAGFRTRDRDALLVIRLRLFLLRLRIGCKRDGTCRGIWH